MARSAGAWLVLLTLGGARCIAASDDPGVSLHAVSQTAVFGLPVVVEIEQTNRGGQPVTGYDLTDPYVATVFWEWYAGAGERREIKLADYHYSAVPEPSRPRALSIAPGESISVYHTVPTPADPAGHGRWTLRLKVRDPDTSQFATAEVAFEVRALPPGPLAGALDSSLAQAALLEYSREDVVKNALDEHKLALVGAAAERGDLLARMILFSAELARGADASPQWVALDAAEPPVRTLRNYVLLAQMRYGEAKVPATSYTIMARGVRAGDPFYDQLREGPPGKAGPNERYFRRGPDAVPKEESRN